MGMGGRAGVRYGAIGLMVLGVGCSGDAAPGANSGNAALGIASFAVEDSAMKTSVIGLAADGQEVGRLDLVHGRYALTELFKEDYPGESEVDGRKLDVTLHQTKKLIWETAGYEPVLHMPAHPRSELELAAFLADPHVRPVLDHWGIGFEAFAGADGEIAYTNSTDSGNGSTLNCSGATTCGTGYGGATINTCGGTNANAFAALRIQRSTPSYTYNEYLLSQCCPANSGSPNVTYPWFAQKTCGLDAGKASTCGSSGGPCKGCPSYPAASGSFCDVSVASGTNDRYCYNETPYNLTFSLASADAPTTSYAGWGMVESGPPPSVPYCTFPGTCTTAVCGGRSVNVTATGTSGTGFTGLVGGGCSGTSTACTVIVSNPNGTTISPTFKLAGWTHANGNPTVALLDSQHTGFTAPFITASMNQSAGQTATRIAGTCPGGENQQRDERPVLERIGHRDLSLHLPDERRDPRRHLPQPLS